MSADAITAIGKSRGIFAMLFACALLTATDAGSKLLTTSYPLGQIVFVRCAVFLLMLLALSTRAGGLAALAPRRLRPQAIRATLFVVATFLFLWSLKLLPLPVVTGVMFLSPLMVAAFSPRLLGETAGRRVWLSMLLGIGGGILVLDVPAQGWRLAMLVPLVGALVSALRDISTRRVAVEESTMSIVFTTTAAATLASLATLPFGWRMPPAQDLLALLLVGIGQGIAYYAQVYAYRHETAATVTTVKYSAIIWSVWFAWLIWDDVPTATTLAGVAIVMASGAMLLGGKPRVFR